MYELWSNANSGGNRIGGNFTEGQAKAMINELIQTGWRYDEMSLGDLDTEKEAINGDDLKKFCED